MPLHDELPGAPKQSEEGWDNDPRWLKAMSGMQRMERDMPDEPWIVPTAQNVAQLIVELDGVASREQIAVLYGVGAVLVREGKREMTALFDAWQALGMIRSVRPGGAE